MEHMWQQDWHNLADMQMVPQNNGEAANFPSSPDTANPPNPPNVNQIVYKLSLMQIKRQLDATISEYQGLRADCLLMKDALVQQYVAAIAQNTPPVLAPISTQIKTINYQITRLDQDNEPNLRHRDEVIASLKSESLLVVQQLADATTLLQMRQAPHFWNGRVFVTANAEEGVVALLHAENVDFEAEPAAA